MELASQGQLEDAVAAFRALAADKPDYVPLYFHAGKTLERLGLLDEARETYRGGVRAASAAGNRHAQDELEAALGLIQ
jgi:tetratricopeptide (TPR) repeat protein